MRAAALALVLVLATACGGGKLTELVVVIDTDLGVPGELDHVELGVTFADQGQVLFESVDLGGEGQLPLTLSLSPSGDVLGPITLSTRGSGAAGVVLHEAVTSFVEDERRMIVIVLGRGCLGATCGAGTSCQLSDGSCVSSNVDPSALAAWPGEPPPHIGGSDGGVDDGGSDGGGTCNPLVDPRCGCTVDADCVDSVCAAGRCVAGPFVSHAIGRDHMCTLFRSRGRVFCRGANDTGQLGDGSGDPSTSYVEVMGLSDANQLAAGANHTCAVHGAGFLSCWGANEAGQLGIGSMDPQGVPASVLPFTESVDAVAAGPTHTCAIASTGLLFCWGSNAHGELGNTLMTPSSSPVRVSRLAEVAQVAVGASFTCAIGAATAGATHGLWCWGLNGDGQLGLGDMMDRSAPQLHPGSDDTPGEVQQIATGRAHACVRLNRGAVFCWGNNGDGQLGDGTTSPQMVPVMTVDFGEVAELALGFQHSTALRRDGQLYGWGGNRMGQLFEGGSTLPTPMRLAPAAALAVWTGNDTTCIFRMGRPTCVGRQTL